MQEGTSTIAENSVKSLVLILFFLSVVLVLLFLVLLYNVLQCLGWSDFVCVAITRRRKNKPKSQQRFL